MAPRKRKEHTTAARHCCVPGCQNDDRYGDGSKLSFFALPKDKTRRKQWICKIRRDPGQKFKMAMETVAETLIVLVCLALATFGGHVTLHFFSHDHHAEPASSQKRQGRASQRKLRSLGAAVLSLTCAGCGTLALHVVATLSGTDLSSLRLHFTRVLLLACPLLLARHVCTSGALRGSGAWAGYRRGFLCLRWTLEGYLWAVLASTTITTAFLQPNNNAYPCWIPVSQSSWSSFSFPAVFLDIGFKSAKTSNVTSEGTNVEVTESYFAAPFWDFFLCSGTCIRHDWPEVLLYCAFFPPLLLYIMLSYTLSTSSPQTSCLTGTLLPSNSEHLASDDNKHFQNKSQFLSGPIGQNIPSFCKSQPIIKGAEIIHLTDYFNAISEKCATLHVSDKRHKENLTTEIRGQDVHSLNLITHPVILNDCTLKSHDSATNKCQNEFNKQSASTLSEVQLNSNDCVSKIVTMSEERKVPMTTEPHQKVQGIEEQRVGLLSLSVTEVPAALGTGAEVEPPEGEAVCSVCRQLSPYIFLAACLLFTQCFLLLPLWSAIVKVRCGQLQFPTPEFAFLPVFTAVCFVYNTIG